MFLFHRLHFSSFTFSLFPLCFGFCFSLFSGFTFSLFLSLALLAFSALPFLALFTFPLLFLLTFPSLSLLFCGCFPFAALRSARHFQSWKSF